MESKSTDLLCENKNSGGVMMKRVVQYIESPLCFGRVKGINYVLCARLSKGNVIMTTCSYCVDLMAAAGLCASKF